MDGWRRRPVLFPHSVLMYSVHIALTTSSQGRAALTLLLCFLPQQVACYGHSYKGSRNQQSLRGFLQAQRGVLEGVLNTVLGCSCGRGRRHHLRQESCRTGQVCMATGEIDQSRTASAGVGYDAQHYALLALQTCQLWDVRYVRWSTHLALQRLAQVVCCSIEQRVNWSERKPEVC